MNSSRVNSPMLAACQCQLMTSITMSEGSTCAPIQVSMCSDMARTNLLQGASWPWCWLQQPADAGVITQHRVQLVRVTCRSLHSWEIPSARIMPGCSESLYLQNACSSSRV